MAQVVELQELLGNFARLDVEQDVVRAASLGDLNFDRLRSSVIELKDYAALVLDGDLNLLPKILLAHTLQAAQELDRYLRQVQDFSVETSGGSPSSDWENRARSFESAQEKLILALVNVMMFFSARAQAKDGYQVSHTIHEQLESVGQRIKEKEQQLSSIQAAAEAAAAASQQAAARTAVTREAEVFEERSKLYRKSSLSWLGAAIVFAAAVPVYVSIVYVKHAPPEGLSGGDAFSHFARRSIVLALLLGVAAWSARNYSVSQHNYVVSKHRADALTVFLAFYNGSESDSVKDAVLLAATSTVFSFQPSGYLRRGAVEQPSANPTMAATRILRDSVADE